MERLTRRDEYGNADIIGVDGADLQLNLDFDEFNRVTGALNLLAAYEDTGLEPEDVKALKDYHDWQEKQDTDAMRKFIGYAEADKEGHLIVLPCKVGDTVYRIHRVYGEKSISEEPFTVYGPNEIGKTVFLTRQEAEAALGGDGDAQ